jgi:hypothetical protein
MKKFRNIQTLLFKKKTDNLEKSQKKGYNG